MSTRPEYAWRRQVYAAVGDKIHKLRIAGGLSLGQLSERLGCAPGTLQNIEQASIPCPLYLLVAIAFLFDVTLDDFVPVDIDVVLRPGLAPREATTREEAST